MRGCSGGACVIAPGRGGPAWDTTRYGDTVNERAVRILLECILVYIMYHNQDLKCHIDQSTYFIYWSLITKFEM